MAEAKFQPQTFINNELVDAADGAAFEVCNPYDNSFLAKVSEAKQEDIDRAATAVRMTFPA